MLDMSTIVVPDDTSFDKANPSMWGVFSGGEPTIGRFQCTFCFRVIEANFPRYHKILDKTYEVDGAIKHGWKSPCCVHNVKRLEVDG